MGKLWRKLYRYHEVIFQIV